MNKKYSNIIGKEADKALERLEKRKHEHEDIKQWADMLALHNVTMEENLPEKDKTRRVRTLSVSGF